MTQENINLNYSWEIRLAARRHRRIKSERNVARRRELLEAMRERTERMRKEYKRLAQEADRTIIQKMDEYDCYTILYKEPLIFEGTKAEAEEYLWEHLARRIYSAYDCTGEHFTCWFKLGYLGDNRWKVAERRGIDV